MRTKPPSSPESARQPTSPSALIDARELALLSKIAVPAWVFDIDRGNVLWGNRAALELWVAKDADELARRDMGRDMSPTVRRRLRQYQEDFVRGQAFSETWVLYPRDEPHTYHCSIQGFPLADGRMAMLVQALSEHRGETTDTLRSVQALLHTPVMISSYSYDGMLTYCNPAARTMLGDDCQSLRAHLCHAEDFDEIRDAVAEHQQYRVEKPVNTAAGERWHELTVLHSRDAISGEAALLISEIDVSERRAAEQRANRLAYHDTLTDLPNRTLLMKMLEEGLARTRRRGDLLAVMFLDLDQFKRINDSLGHAVGDRLLVAVAKRLQHGLRSADTIARLGGDEFVVFVSRARSRQQISEIAERLLQTLASDIGVDGHKLRVTTSLGISVYPDDAADCDMLLKNADLAMYAAKASGRNAYTFYSANMHEQITRRMQMETDLHRALEENQFELYYQPRVSLSGGAIVSAEALLRWRHPQRGTISPGHFIPVAEECGAINAIGAWVLRSAAAQLARWQRRYPTLGISVNVSPSQLHAGSLYDQVAAVLRDIDVDPRLLELEITESMLMEDTGSTVRTLDRLHALGVKLAIDDFGTGYSNLGYLRAYPIDCLKIDRSFITDTDDMAIAEMIITLGRMMKLTVVAEGVEKAGQIERLRARCCDEYQGFYFSEPLPAEGFVGLLKRARAVRR